MAERGGWWRTVLLAVLGTSICVVLVAALVYHSPQDWQGYLKTFQALRWWGVAGVLVTTVLNLALTALKWRYVTRVTTANADPGHGYYYYTAFIALLGQILPMQVAVVTGRSCVMRFRRQASIRRGAVGAVYDQSFDLLIPALVLTPAALYFLGTLGGAVAAYISVALVAGGGVAAAALGPHVARGILKRWPRLGGYLPAPEVPGDHALYSRNTIATLYALSLLRFANLTLRAWLVAWSMGLGVSWVAIIWSNAAVTFSALLAFVPGALGVVEWSWIGTLTHAGVSREEAFAYAVLSRLLILSLLIVLNLFHGVLLVFYRGTGASRNNVQSTA